MIRRFIGIILVLAALSVAPIASAATPPVDQVIIAFKTHFDIGYTDLASNVVQRYRTSMIDQALAVVDQNRTLPPQQQFAWTIPGWPMTKILEDSPTQTPQRRQRILQAFKDGRFVVHALPFTTHTELLEPEDLVRGLGYASRLSRQAGLPLPRDAKMTDVPSHSWILPTLLTHAGVSFLHLGCNAASTSPDVPPLFWWEGPDGSRLLTMYSAAGYGTGLAPPANWPYRTWLALIHTGDNHGPPTPDEVRKLLEDARKQLPGVSVRIGRLSDFADALLAEKPSLPVVRGDMPDTWIHGPQCDPAGASIARQIRPALATAETLHAQLGAWGVALPDIASTLNAAREQSLLYGEHTWGGALYWVTAYDKNLKFGYGDVWKADRAAGRFKRLEASWEEHSAYIHTARALLQPVLEKSLAALSQGIRVTGPRIVVYNPLPWPRSGIVRVKADPAPFPAVRAAEGGPVLPVESESNEIRFVAQDIPPMGYRTFVPAEAGGPGSGSTAQAGILENQFLRITLDANRGGITSILDKRSDRERVDRSSPYAFGQYLYERFDADQVAVYNKAYTKIQADWARIELGKPPMPPASAVPYRALTLQNATIEYHASPIAASATLRGRIPGDAPHTVTLKLTLPANQPYLEMEFAVHDLPVDPWPQALWLCFPVRASQPQFHLGRLGGIADPARDFIRASNRNLQALHTGLAIADPQSGGLGICPLDTPLVSLDTPGIFKFDPSFIPAKPTAFVNLYNNQWSTNFRLWNGGTWTSRFRVWSFDQYTPDASLVTPSLEARMPLIAASTTNPPGALPPAQSGPELSRKGVSVTAFGPNPDGPGTVLRLWEHAGLPTPCELRLPAALRAKALQPLDLRGQPAGAPIPITGPSVALPLRANAPATFLVMTD